MTPIFVTPLRNLPVSKRVILAEFGKLQKLHLCTKESACSSKLGPFGEVGLNFSLQQRTHIHNSFKAPVTLSRFGPRRSYDSPRFIKS